MSNDLLHIIGTRPQIIKVAGLVNSQNYNQVIIDTNQHFDKDMQLDIYNNLNIDTNRVEFLDFDKAYSNNITIMADLICKKIEVLEIKPKKILIYGDTNSTIAGLIAGKINNSKIIHVESGLRTYKPFRIEESNRVIADTLSDYRLTPTKTSLNNLKKEGLEKNSIFVGDIMLDVFLNNKEEIFKKTPKYETYYYSTIHRFENLIKENFLDELFISLNKLRNVILPVHPGLKLQIQKKKINLDKFKNISFIEPLSYVENLNHVYNSIGVLTDSGGLTKESFWLKKPCISLMEENAWEETIKHGYNILNPDPKENFQLLFDNFKLNPDVDPYIDFGNGNAANNIFNFLDSLDE